MQEEIVPPDVHDERDLRANLGNVGEALLRSDADVRAARDPAGPEGAHGVKVRGLVRDQVVAREEPGALGEPGHEGREVRLGHGPDGRPVDRKGNREDRE